jgi:hypothetical protein
VGRAISGVEKPLPEQENKKIRPFAQKEVDI